MCCHKRIIDFYCLFFYWTLYLKLIFLLYFLSLLERPSTNGKKIFFLLFNWQFDNDWRSRDETRQKNIIFRSKFSGNKFLNRNHFLKSLMVDLKLSGFFWDIFWKLSINSSGLLANQHQKSIRVPKIHNHVHIFPIQNTINNINRHMRHHKNPKHNYSRIKPYHYDIWNPLQQNPLFDMHTAAQYIT